jgi:integral membrane protein
MIEQSSTITWLRWVALAEALSYVVLLVAVVAKHGFGQPGGVSVMGPVHGMLFLAYTGLILLARDELGWSARETLLAMLASAVPFGGVAVERRMIPDRDG